MKRKIRRTKYHIRYRYRAKDGRLGRRQLKILGLWFGAIIFLGWLNNYFFTPFSESEVRAADRSSRHVELVRATGVERIIIKKTDPSGATKTYRGNVGKGVGFREDGMSYNLKGYIKENGELILNIDVE